MLHFVGFRKSYGPHTVLNIQDLVIPPGIVWISGANGSGKSTLLKTAGGILSFNGDIRLDQNVTLKRQPVTYRNRVNFAEAEPVFPEFLTGLDMIRLFATAKKAPRGQEAYYIESMKMNSYVADPIGTYSTGMLKKLSLLLAFLGSPQLILLDEPLITLDNESLKTLCTWIRKKWQHDHVSFLLSSHQQPEVESLITTNEVIIEMQTVKLRSR